MGQVRFHKVVSALPSPLEKDGLYLVRTGEGFDLYASDSTGAIAHKVNVSAAVQDTGWRNVTGILQFPSQLTGTRVFVRRVGDICYMMYHSHYMSGRHSRIQSGKPLPAGFHPRATISVPLYGFRGSTELDLGAAVMVGMNGHVIVQTLSNDVRGSLGHCFVYPPERPFPSELPGTPAGF